MLDYVLWQAVLGGPRTANAIISLSALQVTENSGVGTKVGTLTVVNATGTPTFTLDDDGGGKFVLDGDDVEVAAAIDYETTSSINITVSVAGTTPDPDARVFTIVVVDADEGGGSMSFNTPINSGLLAVLEDF
jgi:hypothetical protein